MQITSKTQKDQKTNINSNDFHEKTIKPMQIINKNAKDATTAGGGNVRMETASVDKHSPLTRPHSFASPARSHARHEHETKPKPISRLGVSCVDYFPSISDLLDSHMAPYGACEVAQSTARSNAQIEAERFRKLEQ